MKYVCSQCKREIVIEHLSGVPICPHCQKGVLIAVDPFWDRIKNQKYRKLGGIGYLTINLMTKQAQRAIIHEIFRDSDLDYQETLTVLQFFVKASYLPLFEKSWLLTRFPRSLKAKCVACYGGNMLAVMREKRDMKQRGKQFIKKLKAIRGY